MNNTDRQTNKQTNKQTKPQNDESYRPPLPEGSKKRTAIISEQMSYTTLNLIFLFCLVATRMFILMNERDKFGWTPMHYAAMSGHLQGLDELIMYGASPSITSNLNNTPFHLACRYVGSLHLYKIGKEYIFRTVCLHVCVYVCLPVNEQHPGRTDIQL